MRAKKYIVVYHVTRNRNVNSILRNGFRDSTGRYLTEINHTGVWFSDRPLLDCMDFCDDGEHTVFAVRLPDHIFRKYEWIEVGRNYREALIPSAVVNNAGLYHRPGTADVVWTSEAVKYLCGRVKCVGMFIKHYLAFTYYHKVEMKPVKGPG